MITVNVNELTLYYNNSFSHEMRKENKLVFFWGRESGQLIESHPLFYLFNTGIFRVSVIRNYKGEYEYIGKRSLATLTFEKKGEKETFGICKSFAQGALGKGKRFRKGAYYSLEIKRIK